MIAAGVALALALALAAEPPVLAELERLDRALAAAERDIETTETERQQIQKELAGLEADLAVSTTRAAAVFERFVHRLRALARMPQGARLVLLGGARSLSDYLEMTRLLRFIAAHDRRLQQRHLEESARLRSLSVALGNRRERLAGLEAAKRLSRDQLAKTRQERLDWLAALVENDGMRQRAIKEQSAAARTLADNLRKREPLGHLSADFAKNRGRLPWPAVGPVALKFGERPARTEGLAVSQSGLEIRAVAGAKVQAIAPGEVVYADWLRGYGELVIVDHGDGYHSLVAHLATMSVKTGDAVQTGTTLGTVGDTGSLLGTGLYFELRQRGLAIDPLPWLRR
ncbi:MAG: peptidoglycan DD-metalloendopeptidase family protein [Deltaproteobacteria bacterium]|nr:peptidoglycan DD-metalloendopeptidase family protein [Deltaproteobacteria bacterium]